MKKKNLLSKAEMKQVMGGGVCDEGNWSSYDVCYNCSISYGIPPDRAENACGKYCPTEETFVPQ
ncbi:hypothetical protein ACJVDH_16530 [Pedobacter sp. AW1-32]|uniref:hypothetical protein n=1 Tax=Pedobacter sp. AW1-32 TaxID=3383026 RepID=UPI003FEFE424